MKKLPIIIDEMKALRGADVRVFGQPTTLSNEVNESDLLIDVVDVLEELRPYEVDYTVPYADDDGYVDEIEYNDAEDYLDALDERGDVEEISANNTFNWNAPINHDINFTEHHNWTTGTYLYEICVHRYGDVRANYTDTFVVEFDSFGDFFTEIREYANKNVEVEVDGREYWIVVDLLNDGFEVYNPETYEVIGEIYEATTTEEAIEEIRELL